MTVGRLSALASGLLALGSLALFVATGHPLGMVGLLAAPLPALVGLGLLSEWADWRPGDLLARRAADPDVDRGLAEALEPPVEIAPPDDDAYWLPGLPRPDRP